MPSLTVPYFLAHRPNGPVTPRIQRAKKDSLRLCVLAVILAVLLWTRATTQYSELRYAAAGDDKGVAAKSAGSQSIQQISLKEKRERFKQNNEVFFGEDILREELLLTNEMDPRLFTKHEPKFDSNGGSSKRVQDSNDAVLLNKDDGSLTPSHIKASIKAGAKFDRVEAKERDEVSKKIDETNEDIKVSGKSSADVKKDGPRGSSKSASKRNDISSSRSKSTDLGFNGDYSVTNEEVAPEIVWLMSFPNSGTTYTNKLIQGMTQTTTATNYGQEQSGYRSSIPISPSLPDGPYFRFPNGNYSKYVLTKTHCGGYCVRCTPTRYVLDAKRFDSDCRSGNKLVEGKGSSTKPAYGSDLPKKAVHILRNPLDNIVARLHMQRKNWVNHGDHEEYLDLFQSDKDGFQKWCKFLHATSYNATLESDQFDDTTKELFLTVPCASEFFRYVQWHNLAIEVAEQRLQLPIHTLFYENYNYNYNQTVDELLDFLELEGVSTPPPFIKGKEYQDYFTESEQYEVGRLVKHLATNETWALLKHYFEGILEEEE